MMASKGVQFAEYAGLADYTILLHLDCLIAVEVEKGVQHPLPRHQYRRPLHPHKSVLLDRLPEAHFRDLIEVSPELRVGPQLVALRWVGLLGFVPIRLEVILVVR
jgi:hypothetical protein